jgi:hypothetical protein
MDLTLIHLTDDVVVNPQEIIFISREHTGDGDPVTHIELSKGYVRLPGTVADVMTTLRTSLAQVGNWGAGS